MKINIFPIPVLKDNYVWTLVNERSDAIIVDPGEAKPILHYLSKNKLNLNAIFVTHKHWDHTNGIAEILAEYAVPVFGPSFGVHQVTKPCNNGDTIHIEGFPKFQVTAIPGHTLEHVAFISNEMVFTGDTLFSAGCGRVFEGTIEQMLYSLKKLTALNPDINIYCGHEYTLQNLHFAQTLEPGNAEIQTHLNKILSLRDENKPSLPSKLAIELKINPFLRCNQKEIKSNAEKYAGQLLDSEEAVFQTIREWKNNF